jgi:site-specific DNA-methyltransferase (adenine-specific)
LLYKGSDSPPLDRLAIGDPYQDKSNAKRFNHGVDKRCAGNVWFVDYETITSSDQKEHNDRFPVELPIRCIKLCGYPVELVLDPFCGSGTVGVAAKKLGKSFIGIEKNKDHYRTAVSRIKNTAVLVQPAAINEFFLD